MRRTALAITLLLAAVPAAAEDGLMAAVGKALFDRDWVPAPASTRSTDGLGPLYNARSCAACHRGGGDSPLVLDEAGRPVGRGLVLRLPDDPVYGRQLQTGAMQGQAAEGEVRVTWAPEAVRLGDGTLVELRRPRYAVARPGYGAMASRQLSPRLAPTLAGVGLLAKVPHEAIADLADPDDLDGDGIRGRPGIGRFGLKAEHPTLEDQIAEALLRDLGLSSDRRPEPAGDCTPRQDACMTAPHGDRETAGVEVGEEIARGLLAYVAAVPAPEPKGNDPGGERLFREAGCAGCHMPRLPVGGAASIAPYTDLLLHDLGPDLADQGAADEEAARLWRTAPLWGLGAELASGEAALLHDGRARDALEAILWHGGEAAAARERVRAMDAAERERLLAFLAGL